MGKYQVLDVYEANGNINVKVEDEHGKIEVFGYPLGYGYGDLNMNGEIRAVAITLEKLREREEKAAEASQSEELTNLQAIRPLTKKRIFSIEDDSLPGKKKIKEIDMEGNTIERDKNLNIVKINGKNVSES